VRRVAHRKKEWDRVKVDEHTRVHQENMDLVRAP
jgi:hypothetical protein